ncbi:MAG TPA: immunoglobulin domain-containing protein [Verrucomicrobiae bacterium]|nr:immunoglobulin domain-containing protein [Verrucomicrobiae bacterium]
MNKRPDKFCSGTLACIFVAATFAFAATTANAQFLTNGDFEVEPLDVDSSTSTFPGWTEGNGAAAINAPVAISGNHSAELVKAQAGNLAQTLEDPDGLLTNFIFDCDFALPDAGGTRIFQLNLYHTPSGAGNGNINLIVSGSDLSLYNGSKFVVVLPDCVSFSTSDTSLSTNHLRIVGRYADGTPNYDVSVWNADGVSNGIVNQTFFQSGAPSGANNKLTRISFEAGNVAAAPAFSVVDNVTVTNFIGGGGVAFPAQITSQPSPTNLVVLEGAPVVTISAGIGGDAPLSAHWRFNGTDIDPASNPSATNITGSTSVLTLANVTAAAAGNYSLFLSNDSGSVTSSVVTLTVSPVLNTSVLNNIWNLLPGERSYLANTGAGSSPTERGLAYNPATTNLLLASRAGGSNQIVALNPATGAEKYFLSTDGLGGADSFSSPLNLIGVTDDGVVYADNVTAQAETANFILYRWDNDNSNTIPLLAYLGDPGDPVAPNLRWGDSMAVRGSGPDTQILLAPGGGSSTALVALMTTSDGFGFTPNIITIDGITNSGFAQFGLAFGPGTNTFWAKANNEPLRLIQFDLAASTGTVLHTYSTNSVLPKAGPLGANPNQNLLGVLTFETPDDVRLYDISNLESDPVPADQELFGVKNPNSVSGAGGGGAVVFGGDYLFALDSNNGIKAFLINTNQALGNFSISGIQLQSGPSVVLTWQSVAGHNYQVQFKNNLADSNWTDLGSPVMATGNSTSFTNEISGANRFFRIQGQ